jgi:hypothetical protein
MRFASARNDNRLLAWTALPGAGAHICTVAFGRLVGGPGVRGVRFRADQPDVSCAGGQLARQSRTS